MIWSAPLLVAVFALLLQLKKSRRLNIRIAGALIGLLGFIVVFAAGIASGVSTGTSFLVGIIGCVICMTIAIALILFSQMFIHTTEDRLKW